VKEELEEGRVGERRRGRRISHDAESKKEVGKKKERK
jgi:hypothetical protein